MASFGLKVIRLALSGVAAVSPDAAGRAAFRLFATTPGRRPRTAKEKELFARSEGWMRQAQRVTLDFTGGTAVAHRFAARPCEHFAGRVLVVHGWGSRAAYLSALTEGLVAAGHEVVALDLPGHGSSRGRTLTLPTAVRGRRPGVVAKRRNAARPAASGETAATPDSARRMTFKPKDAIVEIHQKCSMMNNKVQR